MELLRRGASSVAFFAVLVCVGVPHWMTPYASVSLPSSLMHPGLLMVAVAPLALRALGLASFWRATFAAAVAVPAAILARVIFDATLDPTSHNLWPFEVIIATGVALPLAMLGSAAGSIFGRVGQRAQR